MSDNTTYGCLCNGQPAPGAMCGHVIVSNKNLCGYRSEDFCEFRTIGCNECGAKTPEEAEKRCNCAGDKDDCHGCKLWPDIEDKGRPVKPHRSGGGHVQRTDFDKCPYCEARRPIVSGPRDPRPYVCLGHRTLVPRRDFA